MKLTVQVKDSVSPRLRDVQGRFQNTQQPLRAGGRKVIEFFGRIFQTEGGAGARPWKQLRPSTVREKQRAGFGGKPILQRSGRYYRSLSREGGSDQVIRVTANSWSIESTVPYERYHRKGTSKMPARPVELTQGQHRLVFNVIKREMARSIQRLGFAVTES